MSLGDRIRKKRASLKLSQEYVADQLGVSRQAVSKWEQGKTEPNAKNLAELACLFEMPLSELVESEKPTETPEQTRKRILSKNLEMITVGAYTGAVVLWTIKTSDPGFKVYASVLIFILAMLMARNITKLPYEIRTAMAVKELIFCIVIFCMARFLEPMIGNVFNAVLMLVVTVLYAKYVRFPDIRTNK